MLDISEKDRIKVVLPLHPRTSKLLDKNLDSATYKRLNDSQWVEVIPPASFFDIIELERKSRIIMTDSGGVQKESFFFERPCVILRPETEWTEIVEHGAGIIADADYSRIVNAYNDLVNREVKFPPLFGDAHAAGHILDEISSYLDKH